MLIVGRLGLIFGTILLLGQTTLSAQEDVAQSQIEISEFKDVKKDSLVRTAFGIPQLSATLGVNVNQLEGDQIFSKNETNIFNALHSQVTGLTVRSSSGSPGASSAIRLRGFTSFSAENTPLIILDGMPIDNSETGRGVGGVDLSNRAIDINPFDIESATFLKGVSASSLYGVRGSNGVILLTSKSSNQIKPLVTISAGFTSSAYNKLPERQSIYAQGRPDDGIPEWRGPHQNERNSWGPLIEDLEFDGSDFLYDKNGRLVPTGQGNGNQAIAYDPYTFFQNGSTFDLNASVKGGFEWAKYYISAGRSSSTGIIPTNQFTRNSFRFNLTTNPIEKLEIGIQTNYILSSGNRSQRGSNVKGIMLGLTRTAPTFDITNGLSPSEALDNKESYELSNGNQRSYNAGIYDSPYWSLNKNPFNDDVNRIIASANIKYQLLDWLNLNYVIGIDNHKDERFSAIGLNPGRDLGGIEELNLDVKHLNSNLFADMSFNLGSTFQLTGLSGLEYFTYKNDIQSKYGTGFMSPDVYTFDNLDMVTEGSLTREKENLGIYSSWNLEYDKFAMLNVSARNDYSSVLASGRSFLSYSASLGIDLVEWIQLKSKVINEASLRFSYGKVGNDGGSEFINLISDKFGNALAGGDGFIVPVIFPNFGINSFELDQLLGNKNLDLEETKEFETGLNLILFDKVQLDVAYATATHDNLIVFTDINASSGFTSTFVNAGSMESKNLEINANAEILNRNNWKWNLGMIFSKYSTEVKTVEENVDFINLTSFSAATVGIQEGYTFGYIHGSSFRRTEDDRVIVDENGWPLVDATAGFVGDPTPDFTLGINSSIQYKNFTLDALVDVKSGGDMWCGTCAIMDNLGVSKLSADERNESVTFDGVQNIGTDENPQYVENTMVVALANPEDGVQSYYRQKYGFSAVTEMNVFDAGWVRLRNVRLGYKLPKQMLSKSFINEIEVSVSGKNLWLQTDYPGIDPETNLTGTSSGFGLEYFNNPNTKSYSFNVQLKF